METVSVVIPTFNRAALLRAALDSVWRQTRPVSQIVVVDDGSTDDTAARLRPFLSQVTYLYQPNQGAAAARNLGLSVCRGDLVAFLDSDDIWLPDKLERQVAFLAAHPEVDVVACHALALDASGKLAARPMYPWQSEGPLDWETLVMRPPLPINALLVRRAVLPPQPFTPGVAFCEDWELTLRLAVRGPIWFMAEPLVGVRVHGDNLTRPLTTQARIAAMLAQRLGVIERTVGLWCGGGSSASLLRQRAEAQEYGLAAVRSLAIGSADSAQPWLQRAIALDPAAWRGGEALVDQVTHFARLLFQTQGAAGALKFLDRVFGETTLGTIRPKRFRSIIYARIHLFALSDGLWQQGDIPGARRHLLTGLRYDPRLLVDRGVLARLARCAFPGIA